MSPYKSEDVQDDEEDRRPSSATSRCICWP